MSDDTTPYDSCAILLNRCLRILTRVYFLVILDAMSMLAQDTHWKSGESLLEQTCILIPVLNGDSLLCDCRLTAAACVSHSSTTGKTLRKML